MAATFFSRCFEVLSKLFTPDAGSPRPSRRRVKLALIVGHTKADKGARGVSPVNAQEYDWNKELARRARLKGAAHGVDAAVFYRDGGGIKGTYAAAEHWGAEAVIELHFNSHNGLARGTETLHGVSHSRSKAFGAAVQAAVCLTLSRAGGLNRGLKPCPPYDRGRGSVNALGSVPSCLVEPFFGDNPDDAALAEARKDALAECLVKAAAEFLA